MDEMNKIQKWRVPKGQYGYMPSETRFVVLRTLLYFGISIAILAMGWIITKSRLNLLTIAAVLGMLPASKSLVNMIMFLKNKGCSREAYEQIAARSGELSMLYDLVFTTYDKTFPIASLAIRGRSICGYSETHEMDAEGARKHLEDTLSMDGHKGYTVKIFRDMDQYLTRLEQLNRLEKETGNQEAVIGALLSVAL